MWHVTYVKPVGDGFSVEREWVAGYVGNGLRVHALDKHNVVACGCGTGRRKQRSPARFAINGADIDCRRCLEWLAHERAASRHWVEETHAEFIARLDNEDAPDANGAG